MGELCVNGRVLGVHTASWVSSDIVIIVFILVRSVSAAFMGRVARVCKIGLYGSVACRTAFVPESTCRLLI